VAYLEQTQGKPPGQYSEQLLAIDAESGPWLTRTQRTSTLLRSGCPRWELDLDEEVIWFGDEQRNSAVAAVQAIGTFSPEDGQWVWAWTGPPLANHATVAQRVCDTHPEVPEFQQQIIPADRLKAWTLAASVAYLIKAEGCFRLPGELELFVGLFNVTELAPDDPRAERRGQDPEQAREALAGFAGPAALEIGKRILRGLEDGQLDSAIETIYRVCENLEALAASPVGKDTPAAEEAAELAQKMRKQVMGLSLPPGHPELGASVKAVLAELEWIARRYGALPEEPSRPEND